jgi:hypothetical protein
LPAAGRFDHSALFTRVMAPEQVPLRHAPTKSHVLAESVCMALLNGASVTPATRR